MIGKVHRLRMAGLRMGLAEPVAKVNSLVTKTEVMRRSGLFLQVGVAARLIHLVGTEKLARSSFGKIGGSHLSRK